MAGFDLHTKQHNGALRAEPRWPAVLAVLAIAGVHLALPSYLTIGPDWLLLLLICVLLPAAAIFHRRGLHRHNQWLGTALLAVITVNLIASLARLITGLPSHRESPRELLLSAGGLWVSNILLFASWYWRLDAGGPHERAARGAHTRGAFLFPQMTLPPDLRDAIGQRHWTPGFVDYLFLAFTASTAFSPTDVPVLSRWAKLVMMVQASISFGTVAILAARAVNIL